MIGTHGVRAALGALVAVVALVAAAPALGHGGKGPREVRVHGESLSTADPSVSAMVGDLNGTWITTEFDYTYDDQTGSVVGWGTERFDGCLDRRGDGRCGASDPSGALTFRFVSWALLDPATGALIEGRCTHPVTGGEGAFAKASGVVHMRDTPQADGSVRTTYWGRLVLRQAPAARAARAAAPARPAAASGQPAASCGPTTVVSG
jgi:hypothetical protein